MSEEKRSTEEQMVKIDAIVGSESLGYEGGSRGEHSGENAADEKSDDLRDDLADNRPKDLNK